MVDLLIVLQNAYGVEEGYIPSYDDAIFRIHTTGRRLKEAIPDGIDFTIINSNPKIGEKSNSYFPPDANHVNREIAKFNPKVILFCGCNGKILMDEIKFENSVHMPHPAYRALTKKITSDTKKKIKEML
jgi:hypothetical protein